MDTLWMWWIAAVIVVAIELSTGTLYLLMLALGLGAGGLLAWAGQGAGAQFLAAALVAAAGCLWVQRRRTAMPAQPESQRNSSVQIDLGNTVNVHAWLADGTAQVQYRGAQWAAKLDQSGVPSIGAHSIVALQGNTLLLKPV